MANTFFSVILIPLFFLMQNSKAQAQFSLNKGSSLQVEHYHQPFLISKDKTFSCGFYSVGENAFTFSIWFTNTIDPKTVAWTANRDSPVNGHGSKISFRHDGNLVLRDVNGSVVWSTYTNFLDASTISVLNNGNLVIHDTKGNTLWQSFDSPTDTLLPHQPLRKENKLISAVAKGEPSSGYYNLYFDNDNVLKLIYDGPDIFSIYWPNPYFTIFQNGRTSYNSSRLAVLDEKGQFFSSDGLSILASDLGDSRIRRLTLDSDGNLRIYSLTKSDGSWEVSWEAISQQCNIHGLCGLNGICQYWQGITCTCAPGYERKNPNNWNEGCKLAKFTHSCDVTKSRFLELKHVDFYGYDFGFYPQMTYDGCEKLCLQNCTCMGFSYRIDGGGYCYPKYTLFNGYNSTNFAGRFYLRLPADSNYSISETRGTLDCSNVTSNVLIGSPSMFSTTQNNTNWSYIFTFIAALGALESVLLVLGWWYLLRDTGVTKSVEEGYEMILSQFRRFTYRELKEATGNFKEEIGRGSSGVVYRGVLDDKRVVAVKKLNDATQGEEEEFKAEASLIGRINHMNVLRMFGLCSERQHRLLVYEHMENQSLDKFLFENTVPLDWAKRFRIALGVAKGLLYLHHECLEWIIHCDVKPENILLAKDFEPKIADFGLVKLSKRDGLGFATTDFRGTMDYMAPEWLLHLPITSKVDVYSYGVVLLEIVMGRRVSSMISDDGDGRMRNFANEVKLVLEAGDESVIASIVDVRLRGQFNYEQAVTMLRVAAACLQEDRKQRPTMDEVVKDLMANEENEEIVEVV